MARQSLTSNIDSTKAEVLRQSLEKLFGVTVTTEEIDDALYALATYNNLEFETLRGKYKLLKPDTYVLLAVENTQPHNGAWPRYVASLKNKYNVIIVQSILNKRLKVWLINNDFHVTKHNKDNMIWRKPGSATKIK